MTDNMDRNAGYAVPGRPVGGEPATASGSLRRATAGENLRSVFPALLLIPACVFLLYAETFASMVGVWRNSSTFAHGFLVLPVSAFLVWRQRAALSAAAARPSPAGFACLLGAVFFWRLSSEAYAQAGQHLALIAMIVTGTWAVIGTRNARVIRFPLLFAFLAVPLGEFLIVPLMDWTAEFTVWALSATGIPVYLEGYVFTLPSGTFEVVEACSGIRYLILAVVFAVFFAHERFSSWTGRIVFVLGAALGSIVANGIRAYLVVLVAHASDMKLGTGKDHLWYGWIVFALFILMIFWVGSRFADAKRQAPTANPNESDARPQGGMALPALAAALAVVALGPLAQQLAHSASAGGPAFVTLPHAAAPWSGPGPALLDYRPSFTGEYEAAHAGYRRADGIVDVHEIFFAQQRQGSELIGREQRIYDDARWRPVRRLKSESISVQGRTMQVKSLVVTNGREDVLLWYWYDVSGRLTTSEVATKLYHSIQAVLGRTRGDGAVILATPASGPGDGRDAARLEQFLNGHLAGLRDCLRPDSREGASCTDPFRPSR